MVQDTFDRIIRENRIVGTYEQILPEFAATLGASVGTWLKNKATIAIARDFRSDSRMMKRAFTGGLMSSGVSALDFHAAPTPLLQFYIRRFGADAGVMFTSGHYEEDKTSIRLFDENGAELTMEKLSEIHDILKSGAIRRVPPREMVNIQDATGAADVYIDGIKNLIDRKAIAKQNFKVVIDSALGPASSILPPLLTDLNVEVIAINSFIPKIIPKNLPNANSMVSLAQTVRANEADLGIALDVEGSRVVFTDENGILKSSDRMAVGLAAHQVRNSSGTIVISESLSRNIENVSQTLGGGKQKVLRVKNEPGAIAQAIRANQGMFGASDDGSFWAPSFTVDADGMYTTLKVLEMLATMDQPLSRYLDHLPQLPNNHREIMVSKNIDNELFAYMEHFTEYDPELGFKYAIDTLAGVKIVFDKGWVNLLPSSRDHRIIHLTSEADPFEISNVYLDAVQEKIDNFNN